MANWGNANFQQTVTTDKDFARAARMYNPAKQVPVGAVPLSSIVDPQMEKAVLNFPSTTVGQFAFTKTLRRAGMGNTSIDRQLYEEGPAWPMGSMPSGSRGAIAYPAK
jgi:hypothetical protein